MIQATTYRMGALSPTSLIAHAVNCSTPESRGRLQASSRG